MAKKDRTPRGKVIGAFKGFMRSCKLEGFNGARLDDTERVDIHTPLPDGTTLSRSYDLAARDRLLDLVCRLYPDQVDRRAAFRHLVQVATEYMEQGHGTDDQPELEKAAHRFLDKVEGEFRDLTLYVGIEGLEDWYPDGLELGLCKLYRNEGDSELVREIREHKPLGHATDQYLLSVERAPAFFKVQISGHPGRAHREALKEARVALDILRLFLGSCYRDVHQRPAIPRRMGPVGTVPRGEHSVVLSAGPSGPGHEQSRRRSYRAKRYTPFRVDSRIERAMHETRLTSINRSVCQAGRSNRGSTGARLARSIHWFAKGTTAENLADSFLMYAISAESLLSDGRTPKETYAKRMAALVLREDENGSYRLAEATLTREFDKALADKAVPELFHVVKKRVEELFVLRHAIAHGGVLDHDINGADLADFETLVQLSIVSFVDGGWGELAQFRTWMNQA